MEEKGKSCSMFTIVPFFLLSLLSFFLFLFLLHFFQSHLLPPLFLFFKNLCTHYTPIRADIKEAAHVCHTITTSTYRQKGGRYSGLDNDFALAKP